MFPGYVGFTTDPYFVDLKNDLKWNIFMQTSNGHFCEELRKDGKTGKETVVVAELDKAGKVVFKLN